jgi:sulfur-carrier protein adenylyltransferase/sulfurtransferase
VAAQQLAGEGFTNVINLSGGIKGWDGREAVGPEDQGMELFDNLESAEDILKTAYSLEEGLQDFYLRTMQKVSAPEVIKLFRKLADIEDIHKEKLFEEFTRLTGSTDLVAFEKELEQNNLEGGMTTEEYLDRFKPDFDNEVDVISLAMSIEAQALDLYTRAGRQTKDDENRKMLERIAAEEKYHLEQLGSLLDTIGEENHG